MQRAAGRRHKQVPLWGLAGHAKHLDLLLEVNGVHDVLGTKVPDFPFGEAIQRVVRRTDLRRRKVRAERPVRKLL